MVTRNPLRMSKDLTRLLRSGHPPDGATFIQTARPSKSYLVLALGQVILFVVLFGNSVSSGVTAERTPEGGWTGYTLVMFLAGLVWLGVINSVVRRAQARRRAEAQGHWPTGLLIWPDHLYSYVSDNDRVSAPKAAIEAIRVEDDGTIRVDSVNAYGTTVTTTLGTFQGEPVALQARLDDWLASA